MHSFNFLWVVLSNNKEAVKSCHFKNGTAMSTTMYLRCPQWRRLPSMRSVRAVITLIISLNDQNHHRMLGYHIIAMINMIYVYKTEILFCSSECWWHFIIPILFALKMKDCQFDNFVIIGGTISCHWDNWLCHQWWQNCQTDYLWFAVHVNSYLHPLLIVFEVLSCYPLLVWLHVFVINDVIYLITK